MRMKNEIQLKINQKNIKHYIELGFADIKVNDLITIDTKYLPLYSRVLIECMCINCKENKFIKNSDYNKITHNGTSDYYCKNCKSIKI